MTSYSELFNKSIISPYHKICVVIKLLLTSFFLQHKYIEGRTETPFPLPPVISFDFLRINLHLSLTKICGTGIAVWSNLYPNLSSCWLIRIRFELHLFQTNGLDLSNAKCCCHGHFYQAKVWKNNQWPREYYNLPWRETRDLSLRVRGNMQGPSNSG